MPEMDLVHARQIVRPMVHLPFSSESAAKFKKMVSCQHQKTREEKSDENYTVLAGCGEGEGGMEWARTLLKFILPIHLSWR